MAIRRRLTPAAARRRRRQQRHGRALLAEHRAIGQDVENQHHRDSHHRAGHHQAHRAQRAGAVPQRHVVQDQVGEQAVGQAAQHQQEQRHAQHERQPAEAVGAARQARQQHFGGDEARQHHHPHRGRQAQVGDVAPFVEDAGVGQAQRDGDGDHPHRGPANGVARPVGGAALQVAVDPHHQPGRAQQHIGRHRAQADEQREPAIARVGLVAGGDAA
jgi:hypothetical protein